MYSSMIPLIRSPKHLIMHRWYVALVFFQAERHGAEAVQAEQGDEGSSELVGLFRRDLIVTNVGVEETQRFTSGGRVDYLVGAQ